MSGHWYGSIFNNMLAGGDHFHRSAMKWSEQMLLQVECPSHVPVTTCILSCWDISISTVSTYALIQTLFNAFVIFSGVASDELLDFPPA